MKESGTIRSIFLETGLGLECLSQNIFKDSINKSLLFIEDKSLLEYITKNILKMEDFEAPDILLPLENGELLLIEVFQFDSSFPRKSKGSEFKRNESIIFEKAKNVPYYSENYNVKTSLANYRKSLLDSFNNHYQKIPSYIQNVIEKKKIIHEKLKVCFFIIDNTPNGSIYLKNDTQNEWKYYMPIYDEPFVALLRQSSQLDYLFTCHNELSLKQIRFMSITASHIDYINKNLTKQINDSDFQTQASTLIISDGI